MQKERTRLITGGKFLKKYETALKTTPNSFFKSLCLELHGGKSAEAAVGGSSVPLADIV